MRRVRVIGGPIHGKEVEIEDGMEFFEAADYGDLRKLSYEAEIPAEATFNVVVYKVHELSFHGHLSQWYGVPRGSDTFWAFNKLWESATQQPE